MERFEIIATNRMFARFTGHIYNPHGHEAEYLISRYGSASYPLCKLKYHTSLNWLFIVVDTIEQNNRFRLLIERSRITMFDDVMYSRVTPVSVVEAQNINDRNGARLETRQEFMYRALAHFITNFITDQFTYSYTIENFKK